MQDLTTLARDLRSLDATALARIEAGMVEQLAVPLLKQRNPQAQQNAAALAGELAELGAELHRSLLRREVGSDLLP